MANYDFSALNPYEFQELANDIVSALLDKYVERFKQGRDWGIDGRVTFDNKSIGIIQAKHYVFSGVKALVRDLKKHELPKIKKLSPDRYFLVTSLGLSPKDKNDIFELLSPFVVSPEDIIGKDELNSLLTKHASIEKAFPKLWFQTSKILFNILNSKIINASEQLVIKASKDQKFYVTTEQHRKAQKILQDEQIVLITGEPGVGKTTIAEQLCLESAAEGYELYVINDNIDEAYVCLDASRKQLFYFDDFLGSNFLEVLRFNEDSKVMRFIDVVSKNESLRFILTSRTNILDQAYFIGESFTRKKLEDREFLINIKDYSDFDKAMILYSFIWRSNISIQQLKFFVSKKFYREIVNHKSYNPRLLEFITSAESLKDKSPEKYLDYVNESLSNPCNLWSNPYEKQFDVYSRAVIDLVVLAGGFLHEDELLKAYTNFLQALGEQDVLSVKSDFYTQVKILSRSFLKRGIRHNDECYYEVFNPSISDYILHRYKSRPLVWAKMICFYTNFRGIEFLASMYSDDYSQIAKVAKCVCDTLGNKLYCEDFYLLANLSLMLAPTDFENIFSKYKIKNIITYLQNSLKHNEEIYSHNDKNCTIDNHHGILSALNDECLDPLDITYLSYAEVDFIENIINLNDIPDKEVVNIVKMILAFSDNELEYLDSVSSILYEVELEDEEHEEIYNLFYEKLYHMWELGEFENFIDKNKEKIIKNIKKLPRGKRDNFLLDYRLKIVHLTIEDVDYVVNFDYISDMMIDEHSYLFACITKEDALKFIDEHDIALIDSCFDTPHKKRKDKGTSESASMNIDNIFKQLVKEKFQADS